MGDARQTDDPDKARLAGNFDDPLSEAALIPMEPDSRRPSVARGAVRQRPQKLHHRGVGRQLGKRRDIFVAPWPQQDPGGTQRDGHG
jgi:hypothetical protein